MLCNHARLDIRMLASTTIHLQFNKNPRPKVRNSSVTLHHYGSEYTWHPYTLHLPSEIHFRRRFSSQNFDRCSSLWSTTLQRAWRDSKIRTRNSSYLSAMWLFFFFLLCLPLRFRKLRKSRVRPEIWFCEIWRLVETCCVTESGVKAWSPCCLTTSRLLEGHLSFHQIRWHCPKVKSW